MIKVITSDITVEFASNAEVDGELKDKDSGDEDSENKDSENKDLEDKKSGVKKSDNNTGAEMKFKVLKSDIFCQQIYKKAEIYFFVFVEDSSDDKAKEKLKKLNKKIKKWNVKNEYLKEDLEWYLIQIPTFIKHFKLIKGYYEALIKNPVDEKAHNALKKINEILF